MSKLIQILIIILLMIAIAFISRGIRKIVIQPKKISVETLDRWCDETPELYECKFKINNRRDR